MDKRHALGIGWFPASGRKSDGILLLLLSIGLDGKREKKNADDDDSDQQHR